MSLSLGVTAAACSPMKSSCFIAVLSDQLVGDAGERFAKSLDAVVSERIEMTADAIKAMHAHAIKKVLFSCYRNAAVKRGLLPK